MLSRRHKQRSPSSQLQLGSQLAAQGLAISPEAVDALNALRGGGYRLTQQATSLAEKILAKDESSGVVRLFVSLGKEESLGKAAIQLGLALAILSGKQTLIINASAGRPSLDKLFGRAPVRGLTDLLQSNAGWEEVVTPTEVPGLSFLSFGDSEAHRSTALTAHGMGRLLDGMRTVYPQIVMVGPSLEAEECSSLLMCADQIGGIAWGGETTRSEVEDLETACRTLGKPLLGVILSHR